MTLADRIVIMKDGVIQQIGTPQEVFDHPTIVFVAGFIGTPQMYFFDARLVRDGQAACHADVLGTRIPLPEETQKALAGKEDMDVILGIRPEHIRFAHEDGDGILSGTVEVSEMMGSEYHLHVSSGGKDVVLRVPTGDLPAELRGGMTYGTKVRFTFRPEAVHLFDKETEKNLV